MAEPKEPIEAVIARLREALDINEHGNGIVGFNTFAEVNGSDLSRLLDYVEGVRARSAEYVKVPFTVPDAENGDSSQMFPFKETFDFGNGVIAYWHGTCPWPKGAPLSTDGWGLPPPPVKGEKG